MTKREAKFDIARLTQWCFAIRQSWGMGK